MSEAIWHEPGVTRSQRWNKHGLVGATVWLTGLSGSGKSTIATELARELLNTSRLAYILDADNVRLGLNSDLGKVLLHCLACQEREKKYGSPKPSRPELMGRESHKPVTNLVSAKSRQSVLFSCR